jgi:iron complex transport system substrate-binding protein
MRIASLVPSATEALFALGVGDRVVAVTHECDYPPAARELPRLTRSVVGPGLEPAEIDSRVRELTGCGEAIYELDEEALRRLEPDLIVTQALCAVCAVSFEEVCGLAERLPGRPRVTSLDPTTLREVLEDLTTLGAFAGASYEARALRSQLHERLARVSEAVAHAQLEGVLLRGAIRPRVAALEWLDPPYAAGHWVPEMIELAGGTSVIGEPGRDSRVVTWGEVETARPEVVVAMPCGLYADEAAQQALTRRDELGALGAARIVAVDAASTFSRPGPRLVDGVELLAHILHPDRVESPEGISWREITGAVAGAEVG